MNNTLVLMNLNLLQVASNHVPSRTHDGVFCKSMLSCQQTLQQLNSSLTTQKGKQLIVSFLFGSSYECCSPFCKKNVDVELDILIISLCKFNTASLVFDRCFVQCSLCAAPFS